MKKWLLLLSFIFPAFPVFSGQIVDGNLTVGNPSGSSYLTINPTNATGGWNGGVATPTISSYNMALAESWYTALYGGLIIVDSPSGFPPTSLLFKSYDGTIFDKISGTAFGGSTTTANLYYQSSSGAHYFQDDSGGMGKILNGADDGFGGKLQISNGSYQADLGLPSTAGYLSDGTNSFYGPNGSSAFSGNSSGGQYTAIGPSSSGSLQLSDGYGSGNVVTFTNGTNAITTNGNIELSSFTSGSLLFSGTLGVISQNNANLFWDNANYRLGIGTASPSAKLHVVSPLALYGASQWTYSTSPIFTTTTVTKSA